MKINKINAVLRKIQDGGGISVHELDQLIKLMDNEPSEKVQHIGDKNVEDTSVQCTEDFKLNISQETTPKAENFSEQVQTKQIVVKEKDEHKIQNNVLVIEFLLGSQHFAVDLFKTKEIINVPDITPLPDAPQSVLGIIDLRGIITKILDLRYLIHIPNPLENSRRSRIIVLDSDYSKEPLGLLVDDVLAVASYSKDMITFDDVGENNHNRLGVIRRAKEGEARGSTELTVLLNMDYILTQT